MKKMLISIFIIIMFMSVKCYAFIFNPSQFIISQSAAGMALSIKRDNEEENNVTNNIEEQIEQEKEVKEESFFDKIINWFKNLFKED